MEQLEDLGRELDALLSSAVTVDKTIKLTPNTATANKNNNNVRFSSALWYEKIQTKNIVVVGTGGIGSFLVFLLSRVNPGHITMYDMDRIEDVNMAGQLFGKRDINQYKVTACTDFISNYSDYYKWIAIPEAYTEYSSAADIMMCGLDNMSARKIVFTKWKERVEKYPEEERSKCLFIDGRLNAEELQVLCITGNDTYNINRYEKEYLFSDKEADNTLCSYKQTSFTANMIASIMCNLFVNFVANECNPLIDRDLPFFTYYSAETMFLKTEA